MQDPKHGPDWLNSLSGSRGACMMLHRKKKRIWPARMGRWK